jgi:hypothetical protein
MWYHVKWDKTHSFDRIEWPHGWSFVCFPVWMYLYGTVKPDDAWNGRTGTVQCWCPTVLGQQQAAHKLVKSSWCFFFFTVAMQAF